MRIIQEPNKVALWNKRHFEEQKNGDYAACLKYSVCIFVEYIFKMKCLEVNAAVRHIYTRMSLIPICVVSNILFSTWSLSLGCLCPNLINHQQPVSTHPAYAVLPFKVPSPSTPQKVNQSACLKLNIHLSLSISLFLVTTCKIETYETKSN